MRSPVPILPPPQRRRATGPRKSLNRLTRRPAGSVGATYATHSPDATPSITEKPQFAKENGRALHRAPAGQCPAERDLVGVLEVAAYGEPAREARDLHA